MSEYQYYKFLAIDRPLTTVEMAELRELSTRATITPVSLTNEYNWGNFKGDPGTLMRRYFDAHVYVTSWMSAVFMVRLPIEALAEETARTMAVPYILDIKATKTHWIITWSLEDSENYEDFDMADGDGWMARLVPIRDELLRGDLRSLYIGWLASVSWEMMDDNDMEPLCMSGLANPTAAQQALAEFLDVDPDLLAGAGMGRPAEPETGILSNEMDEWINVLTREEVNSILKQMLMGKGQQAERYIKNRFESWREIPAHPGRTVKKLRQNAEKVCQIRLKKEKHQQDQRDIERCEKRKAYLKNLSNDFPKAWASVREPVERGSGRGYDEACRALVDIAEAYDLFATKNQFYKELKTFMAGHLHRKALIQRLVRAGIWNWNDEG